MYSTFHCTKEVAWPSLYSTGREDASDGDREGHAESLRGEPSMSVEHSTSSAIPTQGPTFYACLLPFYSIPDQLFPTLPLGVVSLHPPFQSCLLVLVRALLTHFSISVHLIALIVT